MHVAVWDPSSCYVKGHLVGTVNLAVWVVSTGYVEVQLVGTGECGAMGYIERLFRGLFGGPC